MAKILVVEDNTQLSEMLKRRLERRGHTVIIADDPEVGFSSAKAAQPSVIVLDSHLRGEADWKTTRALKFDEHTREIPIIVLMATNTPEARAAAMLNGAYALHGKPIDMPKLIHEIGAAAAEAAGEAAQPA